MSSYKRNLSKSLHKKKRNNFETEDIVNDDDDATNAYLSSHKKSSVKRQLQKLMNLLDFSKSKKSFHPYTSQNVQCWSETDSLSNEKIKCSKIMNLVNLTKNDLSKLKGVEKLEIEDVARSVEVLWESLTPYLKHITVFSLSCSKVKSVPKEVLHENLKSLKLDENAIKTLPGFDSAQKLEFLSLKNNHLTKFPHCVFELPKLSYLNLSGNNLKDLPISFGAMVNLKLIDLSRNKLKNIPDSIENLKNLTTLNISHNIFFSLNPAISNLKNLSDLQASSNQLNNLPLSFESFQSLKSISLGYNYFKNIPFCLFDLKNLKNANFQNNSIQLISESPKYLTCLNLNNNLLRNIPESIFESQVLVSLFLCNNQLQEIPVSFSKLTSLQVLHLNNNPDLKRIPPFFLEFTSLKHLSIINTSIPSNDQTWKKLVDNNVTVESNFNYKSNVNIRSATFVTRIIKQENHKSIYPADSKDKRSKDFINGFNEDSNNGKCFSKK